MEEGEVILNAIRTLIYDFEKKYNEKPRYIKLPIWCYIKLREFAQQLLTDFNYEELEEKEDLTVLGLKVCPTITIRTIKEIKVF